MTVTIIRKPTPNSSHRPTRAAIDCVVIHADAGASDAGTVAWIGRADAEVSYHYLIGRDGKVYQFVDDAEKAWHAGKSIFHGRANCNDYSIGVSFANNQKGEPFTSAQIAAGVELVAELCRRHCIPITRVTTHAAVSPGRKTDPGPLFPLDDFIERVGQALAVAP